MPGRMMGGQNNLKTTGACPTTTATLSERTTRLRRHHEAPAEGSLEQLLGRWEAVAQALNAGHLDQEFGFHPNAPRLLLLLLVFSRRSRGTSTVDREIRVNTTTPTTTTS